MERFSIAAQIVLIIVGAIGFYEARTFSVVQNSLSKLGLLKRFVFHSRRVTTLEDKETGERMPPTSISATGLIAITPAPRPAGTIVGVNELGHELVIVEEHSEDRPALFYLIVSALAIGLIVGLGRPVAFWLTVPFIEIARSVTVWSGGWSWGSLLASPGHFLLGMIAFGLVYTLCFAAVVKSALLGASFAAPRINSKIFKFILFILFVGASILTIKSG
jgi:hypothetical protein